MYRALCTRNRPGLFIFLTLYRFRENNVDKFLGVVEEIEKCILRWETMDQKCIFNNTNGRFTPDK